MNTGIPFEINKLYKEENGKHPENVELFGKVSRYGELIIEDISDAPDLMNFIRRHKYFLVYDIDYVKWLENKLIQNQKLTLISKIID